ncbi:MAG: hypothetical protein ACK515_06220 [bacterium]|jgi:hypothetical protein|nr:hypothetical protein [Betaproteobacteria bacterium]
MRLPSNTPAPSRTGFRWLRAATTVAAAASLLLAAGCSTTPTELANRVLPSSPLLPDYSLPISRSLSIPLESAVAAALVYWFVDPLGPNWEVAERRMSPTLVHLSLRKKRIATGGDGEPPQIVRRRATELAIQAGVRGYQILEYSESTESETIGTRRVTTALVKLTDAGPVRIQ